MSMIYVRAKAGRRAYDAPRKGKIIPHDNFVPVPDNPYIRRLIDVHEDLELQSGASRKEKEKEKPATPSPAPAAKQ